MRRSGQCRMFIWVLVGLASCRSFPSQSQVDETLAIYAAEPLLEQRITILQQLLQNLSAPQNVWEDKIIEYNMKRLVEIYRTRNDEAILIAVDQTTIDGGFANEICQFYYEIKNEPGFLHRYRGLITRFVKRCVGLSFSDSEIPQ